MTTTTDRPQHMAALERANTIRLGHCELKREIGTGAIDVTDALDDPRSVGNFTVAALLAAQHRWGDARVRKVLIRLQLSERRRVEELTGRQRELLRLALAA